MKPVDWGVEDTIKALSPTNLYNEPIFRAIWSADRMHWASGWWNDYDSTSGILLRRVFEARHVPKYQMAARWVVERWMPPSFFGTPEMWNQATAEYEAQHGLLLELGPYPHEGDYVHIWTCEDLQGNYMELTSTIIADVISLALQPLPSYNELVAESKRKQEADDAAFHKKVDDIIGDPFPFLGRVSNITPSPLLSKLRGERKRGRAL